jgi:hypothetical protein
LINVKEEIHRAVLHFVSPAFEFMLKVATGTFRDALTAKKELGYNQAMIKKYDILLIKFAEYLRSINCPSTADQVMAVKDILLMQLDEELYFCPRWHNKFIELAKECGCLDKAVEPT